MRFLVAMYPLHWTWNLFVFAEFVFSKKLVRVIDTHRFRKKLCTHLKDVLYVGATRPELTYLYPRPDLLFQRRGILKKYDLSVFHNPSAHGQVCEHQQEN